VPLHSKKDKSDRSDFLEAKRLARSGNLARILSFAWKAKSPNAKETTSKGNNWGYYWMEGRNDRAVFPTTELTLANAHLISRSSAP
jgi:hypothetical protein